MIFFRLNIFLENNKVIACLLLFLFSLVFFFWLQYSPTFADPDSFYHVKIAQLISEGGIVYDFPYLPFTVLKDNYIDHHFLYHLFLVPFVRFLPPMVGAKLAQLILDSLVILVFFWLLNKFAVKGAFWYSGLLLFCESFVFRISLVKAQPLSLIIVFMGIYFIVARKYWPLFILSFIYVWTYDGWFLFLILAVLYIMTAGFLAASKKIREILASKKSKKILCLPVLWRGILDIFKSAPQRDNLKLFFSVLIGLALGLIINPYFPTNLYFYWVHIVQIGIINYQGLIGVGAEWYPYGVLDLVKSIALPLILLVLAIVVYFQYYRQLALPVHYLFLLFIFFLISTIKAKRNIEYLVPTMILFSALVFTAGSKLESARKDLKMIFGQNIFSWLFSEKIVKIFLVSIIVVVMLYLPFKTKQSVSRGRSFSYLAAASQYLKDNSQTGDIVFHSDWDDFPPLFYHNSKNYYLNGLDPTFMYLKDRNFYQNWADITLGKRSEELYDIIKKQFGAKYVLVTLDHKKMINNLASNFYFIKVYEDKEAIIYRVL